MSADPGAEREVDLARWRSAIARRWWLTVAGLVLGAIVGGLLSLGGSSVYKASSLISLGAPVSPGGVVISSFATNPRAISEITSSASAQAEAERAAGLAPDSLRGRVSVATVGTATGVGAARATPLISLTVQGRASEKTELAANALSKTVIDRTTAPYVGTKIKTYEAVLRTVNTQLKSIASRLASLNAAIRSSKLAPLDQLVLVSQVDNAEQRQGNLLDQQATTQQQLTFAREVESAKVIQPAVSVRSTARSRRNSVLVGALIGLLLGAIAAIAVDSRGPRVRAA